MVQPVILLIVLFLRGFGPEVQSIRPEIGIGVFASQLLFTVFIGAGFGEEIGWRGFMLPRLGERYSPLVASLFVGMAWFAWHIPFYVLNSDREASDPILPFAAIIFPLSIIFTWAYFRSKESLLLPALLHGSFDAAWDTMAILLPGVVGTAGFQPASDWTLDGFWCMLAIIVVARWGFGLGKERPLERGNGAI